MLSGEAKESGFSVLGGSGSLGSSDFDGVGLRFGFRAEGLLGLTVGESRNVW